MARYETTHPPAADLLLRLGAIAERENQLELRDKFRRMYMEQALDGTGVALASFTFLPAHKNLPEGQTIGRLTLDLNTADELAIARRILASFSGLRSSDPKIRKAGRGALAGLKKADTLLDADSALATEIRVLAEGDPLQPSNRFRISGEGKK